MGGACIAPKEARLPVRREAAAAAEAGPLEGGNGGGPPPDAASTKSAGGGGSGGRVPGDLRPLPPLPLLPRPPLWSEEDDCAVPSEIIVRVRPLVHIYTVIMAFTLLSCDS